MLSYVASTIISDTAGIRDSKDEIEKRDKDRFKNHYMIWWRIDKYACLPGQRDREWFSKSYPVFETIKIFKFTAALVS